MKKMIYSWITLSLISIQCLGVNIVGLDGRKGMYDASTQTAFLSADGDRTVYTDVVEYSQSVTPPNIENSSLKAFATMPNSRYTKNPKGRMGGQRKTITLYGVPQYSTEVNEMPIQTMGVVTKEAKTFEIFGAKGSYNSEAKTAYLINAEGKKQEYTNVIEYSQSVTPPSVGNPKMKAFATMPNPRYTERNSKRAGGQFKNIILYGIEKKSDDSFIDDFVI